MSTGYFRVSGVVIIFFVNIAYIPKGTIKTLNVASPSSIIGSIIPIIKSNNPIIFCLIILNTINPVRPGPFFI